MNEILKETKENVVERQILLNQIIIMSYLKLNNFMFREVFDDCIKMSRECMEAIDKYSNILHSKR